VSDQYEVALGFDTDQEEPKAYEPMPSATAEQLKAGESTFARSKNLIAAGDKATARQIVNVMGRWKTRSEWSDAGIGRKRLIDDYRSGDFFDEDLDQLATDFNKPQEYYIARRTRPRASDPAASKGFRTPAAASKQWRLLGGWMLRGAGPRRARRPSVHGLLRAVRARRALGAP
jgi:hypothetical protein